jgi:hypothetical protein
LEIILPLAGDHFASPSTLRHVFLSPSAIEHFLAPSPDPYVNIAAEPRTEKRHGAVDTWERPGFLLRRGNVGIFRRRRHVAMSAPIQSRHLCKGVATQKLAIKYARVPMTDGLDRVPMVYSKRRPCANSTAFDSRHICYRLVLHHPFRLIWIYRPSCVTALSHGVIVPQPLNLIL